MLAELFEVVAAHTRRCVTGNRAKDGAAAGRRREQSATDGREREQGDDQTGRKPDPAAEDAAHSRRRLVLLDDLDLPVGATLNPRRVVRIDKAGLGMQVVHDLIVGLGVGDVAVDPYVCNERVDRHRLRSSLRERRSYGTRVYPGRSAWGSREP